jgi:hypothetical protein
VDEEVARDFARKFKEAGILLYLHHPLGLPDGPNRHGFTPQAAQAIEILHNRLAKPTGGGMVRQHLAEAPKPN